MVERYRNLIEKSPGRVHRLEDWGRRILAYPINKILKAHYVLMNIETSQAILDELVSAFRFNDAVLRHMIISCKQAFSEPSPMMQSLQTESERETRLASDSNENSPAADSDQASQPQDSQPQDSQAQDSQAQDSQAQDSQAQAPQPQAPQALEEVEDAGVTASEESNKSEESNNDG